MASNAQMKGELRRKKPSLPGKSRTIPEGWVIELSANGTSAQKADCHETVFGDVISVWIL